MSDNRWHWDGNDEEFIGLIKWALVCRKLAREQQPGWIKEVTNYQKCLDLAEENMFTAEAIIAEVEYLAEKHPDWKIASRFRAVLEETMEHEVNDRINSQNLFGGRNQ